MTARSEPPRSQPYTPLPRSLLWLAGLIALVEVLLSLADAGYLADPSLRARVFGPGAFWAALLHGTQPLFAWQPVTMFVTHALLHGGFLHMAMNMAVLLGLGRFCSDRYGGGMILPVFLVGAVAGGAAFGLIATGGYPMVGASGAVFAFLGVWTVWDWRRHQARGASTAPVLRRIAGLAAINALLYFGLGGLLAWEAHLGGFLAGVASGLWLENRRDRWDRAARAEARRSQSRPEE